MDVNDDSPALHLVAAGPGPASLDGRDDDDLMALTAAGRRDAFSALAARHLPAVARYCAKFVGADREGESLALDTLFEVWTQRRTYKPQGRFRVWLFTVARHGCLNHLRGERRRRRWLAPAEDEAREASRPPEGPLLPEQIERLLASEQARLVRVAVHGLSTKLRETVLLRFDQGLEYAEVARIVGAPEVTVRSRVLLALKALRSALATEEDAP